jgi:hypothetical protein
MFCSSKNDNVPAEDVNALARADVVCDLRRKALVVHQEEVNFPGVADQEFFEAVRQEVAGLFNSINNKDLLQGSLRCAPSCCSRNQSDIV